MYVTSSTSTVKSLLVLKHLERNFYSSLDATTKSQIRQKYIVGLYLGSYQEDIESLDDFDFLVAAKGLLGSDKKPKYAEPSIPRFYYSGFNFIPEIDSEIDYNSTNGVIYIGDCSPNKNLKEAIRYGVSIPNKLLLLCRLKNGFERYFLKLVNALLPKTNIEMLIPAENLYFSREFIFTSIASASFVFVPYLSEGAARVVAESECLGKALIMNSNMRGGSTAFLGKEENQYFADKCDSNPDMSLVGKKLTRHKLAIYSCLVNTKKFSHFLKQELNLKIDFKEDELVNAFSGHRNDLNTEWTNETTDEVRSTDSFSRFLLSIGIVGKPPIYSLKNVILGHLRRVYGTMLRMKYIISILFMVIKLRAST